MDMKFLQPATKEEAGGIGKNNMDIYETFLHYKCLDLIVLHCKIQIFTWQNMDNFTLQKFYFANCEQ